MLQEEDFSEWSQPELCWEPTKHPIAGTEPSEMIARLDRLSSKELPDELVTLLADDECCKWFLTWRGFEAQTLINMLQSVRYNSSLSNHLTDLGSCWQSSDTMPPGSQHRRLFIRVLIQLSRRSGLYPECVVRDDIRLLGSDPIAAGRFGEVWKAEDSEKLFIAVKVLRVYLRSDAEKLLKVNRYLDMQCCTCLI